MSGVYIVDRLLVKREAYTVVETASNKSCNDPEYRASSWHRDGPAFTMLRSVITHLSYPAVLRPARQRRSQELPRHVREIVRLSIAYPVDCSGFNIH